MCVICLKTVQYFEYLKTPVSRIWYTLGNLIWKALTTHVRINDLSREWGLFNWQWDAIDSADVLCDPSRDHANCFSHSSCVGISDKASHHNLSRQCKSHFIDTDFYHLPNLKDILKPVKYCRSFKKIMYNSTRIRVLGPKEKTDKVPFRR